MEPAQQGREHPVQGGASAENAESPPGVSFPPSVLKAAQKVPDCPVDYNPLVLPDRDTSSLASALMPWHVVQVAKFWAQFWIELADLPQTVLDMCANIGCDALLLASMGFGVTCVELNLSRYSCLAYNIAAMGFEKLIAPVHGNCLDYLQRWDGKSIGVVYLDPPWEANNGKHDPRKKYTDLFVIKKTPGESDSYVSVFEVMNVMFEMGLTDVIVLKIPPTVQFKQLSAICKAGNTPIKGENGKYVQYRLLVVRRGDLTGL